MPGRSAAAAAAAPTSSDEGSAKRQGAGAAGVVLPPADDAAAWEGTLKKWQGCGSFHRPRWYTGPRLADAPWRTREEDCHVLFLPRAAAHGLDLSFVTHIFLLEAILDPELLEQIVARAHRLGAGGAVVVETVHLFLPGDDDGGADGAGGAIAAADGAASGGAVAGRKPPQNFVCTYCYKSFKQRAACEEHERERVERPSAAMRWDAARRAGGTRTGLKGADEENWTQRVIES